MKRTLTTLGAWMALTATATAATGTEATGTSWMTILLIGFGALIVVGQLVPAIVLFSGMVKGMFRKDATKTV